MRTHARTHARTLTKFNFKTPLEVVRALAKGNAPRYLISFPELLGGEGPSSISISVDNKACRFSTIEARLAYAGYQIFCQDGQAHVRDFFTTINHSFESDDFVAELTTKIVRVLDLKLISTRKDHLYPHILQRKTSEGFSLGAKDHVRDLVTVIRLISSRQESIELPSELIEDLKNLSSNEDAKV